MTLSPATIFRLTTPVGMGYLPAGFAYGVLAIGAGLSPAVALAMSVFIYAGALQFAAVPLLAGGAGLGTVAMTALLINLRHVLYLIPLIEHLPERHPVRAYVVAALTDETYSLMTTLPEAQRQRLFPWVAVVNQGYWVLGSALGVVLGEQAARHIPNLGFALPALFTILAIEQFRARCRCLPIAAALAAYGVAWSLVPGQQALIVALGIGLAALLVSSVLQTHGVEVER